MFNIAAHPSLFWFSGSFTTLLIMAISRMLNPRADEPYVIWSREYWEDGVYIMLVWPGTLLMMLHCFRKNKIFRYG